LLPSVQGFAGYGSRNSSFTDDLSRDVSGWQAGVQLSWDVFDGALTRGRVSQARALQEEAQLETEDSSRKIELEVRVALSNLTEAWEVLESQKKVQEQAEEALRLAQARADAGTGTQLDVLGAQTALTQARTTQIQAQRDYAVARTRLERAIGAYVPVGAAGQASK
jgi:outer membrane protein TolC